MRKATKWNKFRLKLMFRLFAAFDVLTKERFELVAYDKEGMPTKTRFSKKEIDEAWRF